MLRIEDFDVGDTIVLRYSGAVYVGSLLSINKIKGSFTISFWGDHSFSNNTAWRLCSVLKKRHRIDLDLGTRVLVYRPDLGHVCQLAEVVLVLEYLIDVKYLSGLDPERISGSQVIAASSEHARRLPPVSSPPMWQPDPGIDLHIPICIYDK